MAKITIKLNQDYNGHLAGDIVSLPASEARRLLNTGAALEVELGGIKGAKALKKPQRHKMVTGSKNK